MNGRCGGGRRPGRLAARPGWPPGGRLPTASWGVRVHERYMEGTPEVDGRWMDAARPVVCPNVRTGLRDCGRPRLGGPHAQVSLLEGAGRYLYLRVWVLSRVLQGPVRGCPWDRPRRSAGVRTHSGQRAWHEHPPASFAQVRGYMEVRAGAVCKPSAQPTPLLSERGPLTGSRDTLLRRSSRATLRQIFLQLSDVSANTACQGQPRRATLLQDDPVRISHRGLARALGRLPERDDDGAKHSARYPAG